MEEIRLLAEVLKYILPALAVLGGIWMMQKNLLAKEIQKEGMAIRGQALAKIVPLRLQAYERAILFLERIAPENLIMRMEPGTMKSKQLWQELQSSIRAEYEHNLAQQLYISPEAWNELVSAKEAVLTLVNQCGVSTPPANPGLDLARKILAVHKEMGESPTTKAVNFIKEDLQRTFRLIK